MVQNHENSRIGFSVSNSFIINYSWVTSQISDHAQQLCGWVKCINKDTVRLQSGGNKAIMCHLLQYFYSTSFFINTRIQYLLTFGSNRYTFFGLAGRFLLKYWEMSMDGSSKPLGAVCLIRDIVAVTSRYWDSRIWSWGLLKKLCFLIEWKVLPKPQKIPKSPKTVELHKHQIENISSGLIFFSVQSMIKNPIESIRSIRYSDVSKMRINKASYYILSALK